MCIDNERLYHKQERESNVLDKTNRLDSTGCSILNSTLHAPQAQLERVISCHMHCKFSSHSGRDSVSDETLARVTFLAPT
jgi:hypothetical protein